MTNDAINQPDYTHMPAREEAISITENTTDESDFISRARSVEVYSEYMAPYKLVQAEPRLVEPTYFNPRPGTCMLFQAP